MASSTDKSDPPLWEQSKENAAPLQRGRNVAVLEQSFRTTTTEKEASIHHYESTVRRYEQAAALSRELSETDDPLIHWVSYIKFYQESFPADKNQQFLLLERCFRSMMPHERYKDDIRFIQVCCQYAEMTSREEEIFRHLYLQKIGLHTAAFWVAWAYKAEKDGDFKQANKILSKGLEKYRAQPFKFLQQRYLQFQRRLVRHVASQEHDDLEEYDDGDETRGALGGLTQEAVRRNDRAQAAALARPINDRRHSSTATYRDTSRSISSHARTNDENVLSGSAAFAIYADDADNNRDIFDDSFALARPNRVLEREQDARRENIMQAEAWNGNGGLRGASYADAFDAETPVQQSLSFSVHVDDECLAEHRREQAQQQSSELQMRNYRDERAFQERQEGRSHIAELLSKDPLRYTRDPTLLNADQSAAASVVMNRPRVAEARRPLGVATIGRGHDSGKSNAAMAYDSRLLINALGVEQSFEEARARAQYYRLAPHSEDFNLFRVMEDDAESELDVTMEEATIQFQIALPSQAPLGLQATTGMMHPAKPSDFASSAGLRSRHDSPSANSMNDLRLSTHTPRNSSVNLDDSRPPHSLRNERPPRPISRALHYTNRSYEQESSFPSVASSTVDESIAVGLATGKEEQTVNTFLAHKELSMMFGSPMIERINEGGRHEELALSDELGNAESSKSFDQDETVYNQHQEKPSDGVGFEIFCEQDDEPVDLGQKQLMSKSEAKSAPTFAIFEGASRDESLQAENPDGDPNIAINNDGTDASPGARESSTAPVGFLAKIMFCDDNLGDDTNSTSPRSKDANTIELAGKTNVRQDEETADITSLLNCMVSPTVEIARIAGSCLSTVVEEDETIGARPEKLEMVKEETDLTLQAAEKTVSQDDTVELPRFGDISAIIIADEEETVTMNLKLAMKRSVDYAKHYKSEMQSSMQRLKSLGQGYLPSGYLSEIFASKGLVCSCPNDIVPRAFRLSSIGEGTEIKISRKTSVVRRELGRGAFGIVVLLDTGTSTDNLLALKVQRPASCLASEFEIMQVLDGRLRSRHPTACATYFPRSLAYLSLADGAMMSMSAASSSGLTIVDLVNLYKTHLKCELPEVLALHYTSRMLHHLEILHWHGKVLHCDAKADNWVLSKSDIVSAGMTVDAAELMLVDFGRAVDLESLGKLSGTASMETMLTGEASPTAMQCVSMKEGFPWSFDVDTFGVCATAHILLFGTHLEIVQDSTNRWMPSRTFKLHNQTELWENIFGSLLNLDDISKTAIGSHPSSVRRLRAKIVAFLSVHRDELIAALRKQALALPASRQELYE